LCLCKAFTMEKENNLIQSGENHKWTIANESLFWRVLNCRFRSDFDIPRTVDRTFNGAGQFSRTCKEELRAKKGAKKRSTQNFFGLDKLPKTHRYSSARESFVFHRSELLIGFDLVKEAESHFNLESPGNAMSAGSFDRPPIFLWKNVLRVAATSIMQRFQTADLKDKVGLVRVLVENLIPHYPHDAFVREARDCYD